MPSQTDGVARCGDGGADRVPLPCLNSNISNGRVLESGIKRLSTNHRKTAFKLAKSVSRMCERYGVERVGFLTLTFADHVTCAREAGKRLNSLRTGVLGCRYVESICVLERMKSGRIHFHLLVVLGTDIRTGFDFAAAGRGDYRSANSGLRAEWAFWRGTARDYGFGRTELMPVKSNEEGLSKYVGKYVAKHVGRRETRDKGVRLVRYSRGASIGSNAFMFASPRSKLWRWQVGQFAAKNGCPDLGAVRGKFGRRWAYQYRAEITAIEPKGVGSGIWMTWLEARASTAKDLALAGGLDFGDVWNMLYRSGVVRELFYEVPKFTGHTGAGAQVVS